MASTYKLVFAGPVGAGKTTAIQSLSDIEVVRTDASATDDVKTLKPTTTVAMDYGLMKLDSGDQVRLYGTPGQKRFDFMWDIVAKNALGLVLMIKGSAPDPLGDLRTYVHEFRPLIDRSALAVGITHADLSPWDIRQQICAELSRLGLPAIAMEADARQRSQVALLVKALIYGIDPFNGVDRAAGAAGLVGSP